MHICSTNSREGDLGGSTFSNSWGPSLEKESIYCDLMPCNRLYLTDHRPVVGDHRIKGPRGGSQGF